MPVDINAPDALSLANIVNNPAYQNPTGPVAPPQSLASVRALPPESPPPGYQAPNPMVNGVALGSAGFSGGVPGASIPQPAPPPAKPQIVYAKAAGPEAGGQGPAMPRPHLVGASNQALVDPKFQAQEQQSFAQQRGAIGQQQDAQRQVGQAESGALEGQAAADLAQAQTLQSDAGSFKDQHAAALAKQDEQQAKNDKVAADMAKDYEKTPDQIWENTGTFDKIRYTLANAMGGFLMGFNHMDHNPIDAIGNHIRGEVEAARSNYAKKKDQLNAGQSAFDNLVKRTGSIEQAANTYHTMLSDAAGLQAKSMATEAKSPTAMANANLIATQLSERDAQVGREGIQAQERENRYVPAHVAGGAGVARVSEKAQPNIFTDPKTGKSYVVANPDDRKTVAGVLENTNELDRNVARLKESTGRVGFGDRLLNAFTFGKYKTEDLSRATNDYTATLAAQRKGADEGVWKAAEQPLFDKTLQDPGNLIGNHGVTAAQADELARLAANKREAALTTAHPYEVQRGWVRNPKTGELEPGAEYTGGEYQPPPTATRRPAGFKE